MSYTIIIARQVIIFLYVITGGTKTGGGALGREGVVNLKYKIFSIFFTNK